MCIASDVDNRSESRVHLYNDILSEEMFLVIIQFFIVITWKGGDVESSPPRCDSSFNPTSKEGIIGETKLFQWIGIIKVHLHEEASLRIALTGIVLVKEGYAIANADDVARIPKRIFKENSIAMFIPRDYEPWFCRLRDYLTHPEYQRETVNTIALVELNPGSEFIFPMRPICWPSYAYNTQLYAAGYTDDNELLEKFILKLQYVDDAVCKEFYSKAELGKVRVSPMHYQCAFTRDSSENCIWDNGVAIISNASGYWTLIGLSVHGPGCAAPGRYIDLQPYYKWINSATNPQEPHEVNDYAAYRRSAFNEGFKTKQQPIEEIEYIPAHTLLRTTNDTLDNLDPVSGKHETAHYYPFNTVPDIENIFTIKRINQSAIYIHRIKDGQSGNCSLDSNHLIYREDSRVEAPRGVLGGNRGTIRYKLSMFDLYYLNYSCVKLQVSSAVPDAVYLYYATEIDQLEGVDYPENPDEIIRVYPIIKKSLTTTDMPRKWRPHSKLKAKPIKETLEKYNVYNLNIYLQINFEDEAWFKVHIYGPLNDLITSTETEKKITPSTTTIRTRSTRNPYYETEPPQYESLRSPKTDPKINKSLRYNILSKKDIISENTESDVSTTITTPIIYWGRQIDDEDNDNRRYWNTWKRLDDKARKDRFGNVNDTKQVKNSLVKQIEEEAYKNRPNNNLRLERKNKTYFSKVFDTEKQDLNRITLENISNYVNEQLDNLLNKSRHSNQIISDEVKNKNIYLVHDAALVEEVTVNLASTFSVSLFELIALMILPSSVIEVLLK